MEAFFLIIPMEPLLKLRYKPHGDGAASTQINIHLIAQSLLVPYFNKSRCTQDDRGQAAGTSYKSLCCCEPNLRRPQIHRVGQNSSACVRTR